MELKWTDLIELTDIGVSRLLEVSGVYRLSYLNGLGEYIVYYVGQADNLRYRLRQHIHCNEVKSSCLYKLRQYRCFFRAAVVSNQAHRDGAEVALYNYFQPDCVDRTPSSFPLSINMI